MEKFKFRCTSRKRDTKIKGVTLVITYHPWLKDFVSAIRKHLYILYLSKQVKEIFTPGPMVSFWGARKLVSYLFRAKLYPIERSVGSFKCNGKRCQVCLNVTETKTFSSTVTKKEYIINHKFNCIDKCLIYLLTYKKCMLQYVVKIVDEFRLRWNNYKINDRNFLKGPTVCSNIYLNILLVKVIEVFLKMLLLYLSIRLTLKIRTDGNIIGGIHLRQWYLLAWILKMTRLFLQFLDFYAIYVLDRLY